MNWDTVYLNKNKGGLGVCRLLNLNRALLGKWIWRFTTEKEAPWRHFITLNMGLKLEVGSPRGLEEVMGLASEKKFIRKLHI